MNKRKPAPPGTFIVQKIIESFNPNPVHSKTICSIADNEHGIKLTDRQVRLCVEYLRNNDIIWFLLSDSRGYFIESNPEEIRRFKHRIKSSLISQFRMLKRISLQEHKKLNSPNLLYEQIPDLTKV